MYKEIFGVNNMVRGRKPNLDKYRNIILMKNNNCKINEIKFKLSCSSETIYKAIAYAESHPNFIKYTGLNIVKKNEQQRIEYYTALQLLKKSVNMFEKYYANNGIIKDMYELYRHTDDLNQFLQGKLIKYKII